MEMDIEKLDWKEITQWGPEHISDLQNIGFSLFREGMYEKAKIFFEVLAIIDSKTGYNFQALGAIYLELGDYEKSISACDKAIKLLKTDAQSLLNKAKSLLSLNKHKEAIKILKVVKNSSNTLLSNDALALLMTHFA